MGKKKIQTTPVKADLELERRKEGNSSQLDYKQTQEDANVTTDRLPDRTSSVSPSQTRTAPERTTSEMSLSQYLVPSAETLADGGDDRLAIVREMQDECWVFAITYMHFPDTMAWLDLKFYNSKTCYSQTCYSQSCYSQTCYQQIRTGRQVRATIRHITQAHRTSLDDTAASPAKEHHQTVSRPLSQPLQRRLLNLSRAIVRNGQETIKT